MAESVKANFKQAWVCQFKASDFRVLSNVVFWEFIGPSPKTFWLVRGSRKQLYDWAWEPLPFFSLKNMGG